MWSSHEKNIPARGFSTPPVSWKSQHSPVVMPMSERKIFPSGCKRDLFHVIHKVPAGDSPYVRAKHVQLIVKDPSKAISLFWAAINSGDRVDSALKDMAVVMKQLDRSDEAIEAIKSFRHLCPYDSQESLDNVLVELYKRSGKIEEEIEMLQRKLKNIEEGVAFGGKRTKTARSQGRKIQITVEQERSRILGNLAWAYLQHHDYGLAEQYYRKALSLESDKNKQCNLAICLMHMNRIPEAKSLIQAVSASSGGKQMDDSYARSFERAVDMLTEIEPKSVLESTEEDKENQMSWASPATRKLKEVTSSTDGGQGYISGFMDSRRWENGHNQEPVLSDKHDRGSYCGNHSENQGNFFKCDRVSSKCILSELRGSSLSSQQSGVDSDWRKGHCFESPGEQYGFSCKMKENWIGSTGKELGSAQKKMFACPATVLYTQPRIVPWRFGEGDQKVVRQEEDRMEKLSKNVLAHTVRNLDGELDSTDDKSDAAESKSESSLLSPPERNWRGSTRVVMFSQPSMDGHRIRTCTGYDGYANAKDENGMNISGATVSVKVKYPDTVGDKCLGKNKSIKSANRSWEDMVAEEEKKLLTVKDLSPCVGSWDYEEEFNDENQDYNKILQSSCPKSPVDTIGQKLEAFDIKDGYDTYNHSVSPRNPTARRSLCFDGKQDFNTRKKNRLQVFRDITPSPDSP